MRTLSERFPDLAVPIPAQVAKIPELVDLKNPEHRLYNAENMTWVMLIK